MYRVLIADDDEDVRGLVRAHIENLGHEVVVEATNGEEAVKLAVEVKPDVAILDIRMPGMTGIDAAHEIMNTAPCPIIFLTAYAEEEIISGAGSSGAFYYLVKPFRAEDLAPAITLSIIRFNQMQETARELEKAKQDLEDRKIIEKAKGVLIDKFQMSEHEAFRKIHFTARSTNRPMVAVATEILESGQMP